MCAGNGKVSELKGSSSTSSGVSIILILEELVSILVIGELEPASAGVLNLPGVSGRSL